MMKSIDQINLAIIGIVIAVCYAISFTLTLGFDISFPYPILLSNLLAAYVAVSLMKEEEWRFEGVVLLVGIAGTQYYLISSLF